MNDLMTLADIAKMFRCTPAKVPPVLALPGFPPPAPTSSPRLKRWLRSEVRAFKQSLPDVLREKRASDLAAITQRNTAIETRKVATKRLHGAKRRTAKMQRTPPWADHTAIRAVYERASRLENSTGILHHVDHVIPLQGRFVSGLHVAENLQVLTQDENLKKHNRHEVDG